MSKSSIENRRKSVVISGLIGSAGIFVSKFIGLFYAVPFSAILGSDVNSAYYGVAFQLYSYLLNCFTAICQENNSLFNYRIREKLHATFLAQA